MAVRMTAFITPAACPCAGPPTPPGGDADEFGALEGEPGDHEHADDRHPAADERGLAHRPAARARCGATDDAEDHQHAEDEEGQHGGDLDRGEPESALAEGFGR